MGYTNEIYQWEGDNTQAYGNTGAITEFADGGGGEVTVTSASHGREAGDEIIIFGTTNYDGVYEIQSETSSTFNITATYVADDATGIWIHKYYRYKGRLNQYDKRIGINCGRILLDSTDFETYWTNVRNRRDVIARNLSKLASGVIGLLPGGGWAFDGDPVGGDALETVPNAATYSAEDGLIFRIYRNGSVQDTKSIYRENPFKMSGGKKSREWYYEVLGNVNLHMVDIASRVKEIMSVEEEED